MFQQHSVFLPVDAQLVDVEHALLVLGLGKLLVGHLGVDTLGLREETDALQLVLEVVQGVLDLGSVVTFSGVEGHCAAHLVVCPVLLQD